MTPDPKAPDAAVDTSTETLLKQADELDHCLTWCMASDDRSEAAVKAVIKTLRSLASQPAETEARYSAIRDAALEDAAKVADEMTAKWGNPIGSDYEQGVNDQGIRIAGRIRTRILKAPPAEPEGFETTAEERAQWLRMGSDGIFQDEDLTRCARDLDRVLRENARLAAAAQTENGHTSAVHELAEKHLARAEKAEAENDALRRPVGDEALSRSLGVADAVPTPVARVLLKMALRENEGFKRENAELRAELAPLKQPVGDEEVEKARKDLTAFLEYAPLGPGEKDALTRVLALLLRLSRENEEKDRGLSAMRKPLEMLFKWFEITGSSIDARWTRIPPVERKAIVDATRAALSAGKEGAE